MTEARRKRTLKLATLIQLRERLLKWRKNRAKFEMPLDTEVLDLTIENVEKFITYMREMGITEHTFPPNKLNQQ